MERVMKKINCDQCSKPSACCSFGAWVDLEEAKRIAALGLEGEFYHLEVDKDFPSGYRVGTSYGNSRCSFLTPRGLCSIHMIDYKFKPSHCKEFPYENKKLSPFAKHLCLQAGLKKITKRLSRAGRH